MVLAQEREMQRDAYAQMAVCSGEDETTGETRVTEELLPPALRLFYCHVLLCAASCAYRRAIVQRYIGARAPHKAYCAL